jgi:ribosomal protein S1
MLNGLDIEIVPFEKTLAMIAARSAIPRHDMSKNAMDYAIGSYAYRRKIPLITNNKKHFAWLEEVYSPEEFMKEGEEIEAVIISDELDRNYKVQLGVKQLTESQWKTFFSKNKPGNIIPVVIKKITDRGITVEVTRTIEGFVRLNDADEETLTLEQLTEKFKPGEQRDALIVRMEPEKKKIYLSLRAVNRIREREEIEKYMKSGDDTRTTIGDLLQNELDRRK